MFVGIIDDDLRKLLVIGKQHKRLQFEVIGLSSFAILCGAVIPFLIRDLVNGLVEGLSFSTLAHYVVLLVVFESLYHLGWWLAQYRAQVLERE